MSKDKLIDKIRKLLALGDISRSNTTVEEAEAAMSAAYKLMSENNISHTELEEEEYINVEFDEYGNRPSEIMFIGSILTRFFFVKFVEVPYKKTSRFTYRRKMVIFGSKENIEIAKYIYTFLERTYKSLWKNYTKIWQEFLDSLNPDDWVKLEKLNWLSHNEISLSIAGFPSESKKVDQKFKYDYYVGLTNGIAEKLEKDQEAIYTTDQGKNALIVLKNKLDLKYKDAFPNSRKTNGKPVKSSEAAEAGFRDSKDVNIRQGISGSEYSPKALEG